ncbi:MAG TPA: hypothetical protein PKC73_15910 [Dermatophilaceae bacterium]|nr:hypothetical protein [Dermatophilaceae bacterium]HMT91115.1 hypothetical protein [Dermatophilaceae bacterium]
MKPATRHTGAVWNPAARDTGAGPRDLAARHTGLFSSAFQARHDSTIGRSTTSDRT